MILSRTSSFYCEYLGELPFIFTFPVTLDHISSTPQLLSLRVHGEFFRVLFLALLLLASPPRGGWCQWDTENSITEVTDASEEVGDSAVVFGLELIPDPDVETICVFAKLVNAGEKQKTSFITVPSKLLDLAIS
ncbi:PREDICTED: translocon-associated protein subunit alpha-like isoform X1 [Tarenaya hassleriana]|uniref:translocon-associated protein subunit alpha-like isoform X1 n=1 Tax=Tarenaya hassleriana TaxID=28532 RepID=UPI00053C334A|nr:PREDICTED: translocon-associated protein subunit alpha-like isoform X1 [Tarenaya hassleriana]